MESITSRRNAIVDAFRAAARERDRTPRTVLLEGVRLVDEARAAGVAIELAAVSQTLLEPGDGSGRAAAASGARSAEVGDPRRAREAARLARRLDHAGTRVVSVPDRVMASLSPARTPSGLVAIAEVRPSRVGEAAAPGRGPVILLVDVQDPGNVGAVVRAAEAAGAGGVIATGATADPFGWKALRGAMGSAFRLPVAIEHDPRAAVEACRARGLRIVSADPRAAHALFDLDLRGAFALLLGNEGAGLPPAVARLADVSAGIPMQAPVESLNVAITAALFAYEAQRQRRQSRQAVAQ